jgi:hypothetical protein
MIKYVLRFNEIKKVEVEKETDKFVIFLNKRRETKRSDYNNYFDTFIEAKQYAINNQINRIEYLKEQLQKERINLENINKLEEIIS